ncbi:MAG: hypothetical protein COA78_11240 [Blastopirellula sp.]|nr:MAG: hypothetical protein COA78_11240 [Blastopirellula sp.]
MDAFNALYGQWDERLQSPKPDRESSRTFVDSTLRLDQNNALADALTEHKRLVMTLLDDEYLSSFFWKEPTDRRAKQSKKSMYDARSWYLEGRWTMILDKVIERVYFMRCQLVHGAATHGGRLNRTALRRCVMMMQRILPAILVVWIDHGADEDWGPMCYTPLP